MIADCGGFIIPMLLLQFFAWSTPEQMLRRNVLGFFQNCRQTICTLGESPPWTDRGKSLLAAHQAGLSKRHKGCGLFTHLIDPRRAPQNDSAKVGALLASMQSLIFRIELTEHARRPPPDTAAFATLITAVGELRTSFEDSLKAIEDTISGHAPIGELPDHSARIEEFRRQLDALRGSPAVDTTDRGTVGRALVLAGYYRALADAIDRCHQEVKALNWQSWERSYL